MSAAGMPVTATPLRATRPFHWSVRREVWENRSLYLAPLAVAALVVVALSIGSAHLPRKVRAAAASDPAQQHLVAARAYRHAPAPIMLASFLVGMFYCLDALYGERRDRSILFWKSMPVSDVTTVLAKTTIPLVVLPVIALALSAASLAILTMVGTLVLLASGLSAAPLWSPSRAFREPLIMLYGLTVHALWFAPIYGWLLLVSAWARRTPVLWATLPLFAIALFERLAFDTGNFRAFLRYRVSGAMAEAFTSLAKEGGSVDQLVQLRPLNFLGSAGLWTGLALWALFVVAAVRLRRRAEPL